jgi:hypothetical protein
LIQCPDFDPQTTNAKRKTKGENPNTGLQSNHFNRRLFYMHALTMTKMETLKQRGITIVDVKQVSQASKASKLKRLKCNIAIAP